MPSFSGLAISAALGAAARGLQVRIIGKKYPPSWDRLVGYGLSVGAFVGGYLVVEQFTLRNSETLKRRLAQLREQRAQSDAFHQYDHDAEYRLTAQQKSKFFWDLVDTYGKDYK